MEVSMNWAKVKSILIVIFLILNAILGYMNYQKNVKDYTLNNQQESKIKKILYNNKIMLYTLLPKKYPPMKKLALASIPFREDEEDNILKAFFKDKEGLSISIESIEQNKVQTVYDRDGIKIGFSDGRITYKEDLIAKDKIIITKEEAKKVAENFLKKMGYDLSMLKLDFVDEDNGQYKFLYYETYKGNYLYNSYIKIVIKPEGIESADIYRIKPVKFIELSRSIYAPDEMLFGFMNQIKVKEKLDSILVIQKIDIGYLIESEEMWINGGEAVPYYRITLADGRSFFINAYTNEMTLKKEKIQN